MTANQSGQDAIDRIRSLLQPARRELRRSMMRACAGRVLIVAAWALVTAASLEAAALWIAGRYAAEVPGAVHWLPAIVGAAAVASTAVMLVRAERNAGFAWLEVAQRIDAACDGHNRIATSWSLAQEDQLNAFALAAIQQGMARLEEVTGGQPVLPAERALRWNVLASIYGIALTTGCVLTWVMLSGAEGVMSNNRHSLALAGQTGLPTTTVPADKDDEQNLALANSTQPAAAARVGAPNDAASDTNTAAASRAGRRQGNSAVGSRGGSDRQQATGSAGDPDANPLSGAPVAARKAARPGDAQSHSQSSGSGTSPSSGAISGGGAGRGRAIPVKNQGQQREAPTSGELEAERDDESIDEEQTSNEQRGGVQPSLPDRTEAPSRELGISGPQSGKPGTGRGGPSPAKKARGVASLLMGVPIPDFVKGKAGPGATAVTVEETLPVVSPGNPGAAATARLRSEPESIVPRYDIAWSDASIVQEYSRRWQRRAPRDDAAMTREAADRPGNLPDTGAIEQGAARP